MTRREFSSAAAAAGMSAAVSRLSQASPAPTPNRPNILFVCSDQHIGTAMGCQGHAIVKTPNMDRLAARGVLFRNAYSTAPVCVPGRASLMTGMYASDVGSYSNSTCFTNTVPAWSNRLHDHGYYCRASGKLDLTEGMDYGFEEVNTAHEHSKNPDITSLFRTPVCYRVDTRQQVDGKFTDRVHHDDRVVQETLHFLRDQAPARKQPWVAYAGLTLPHPPFVARKEYADLYLADRMPLPNIPPGHLERLPIPIQVLRDFNRISTPIPEERVRRARASYFGMITEVDASLGRLMDELERAGRLDDTVIVYTSDHGEMLGEHGLWFKNNLLENAARIPLIIAGGGLPRGKIVDTPVSHVDTVATLLELAGAPGPVSLRGHSLAGLARGVESAHPGYAFSESHSEGNCTGSFMIRKGDWKYVHFTWYGNLLFDLKSDPGEFVNRAGEPKYAEVEKELHEILASLLDPDEVTRRGFDAHDKVLAAMVRQKTPEQFYETLAKRLGKGQAKSLAYHYSKA